MTDVATSGKGGAAKETFEGSECIKSLGSSSGSPRFHKVVSTLRISLETSENIDVARQAAGARFRKIWCNSFVVVDLEKKHYFSFSSRAKGLMTVKNKIVLI